MSDEYLVVGEGNPETATFKWVINNFSELLRTCERYKAIRSPTFLVTVNNQITEWSLSLYPRGKKISKENNMSLYAECLSNVDSYVKMTFKIDVRDIKKSHEISIDYHLIRKGTVYGKRHLSKESIFGEKCDLNNLDSLIIFLELSLGKTKVYYEKIERGIVEEFDTDEFKMLHKNEKLSDVTFLIDNGNICKQKNQIKAHKYVLAKKSSVFYAMFRHDTLENRNNEIKIVDISYAAINAMLYFIYTGKIHLCEDIYSTLDILKAADKYALEWLKIRCERKLCGKLKLKNALELVALADQYSALSLKSMAIDLIVSNADVIVEKPEFESFSKLHPQVVSEIFCQMASKIKSLNSSLNKSSSDEGSSRSVKRQRLIFKNI